MPERRAATAWEGHGEELTSSAPRRFFRAVQKAGEESLGRTFFSRHGGAEGSWREDEGSEPGVTGCLSPSRESAAGRRAQALANWIDPRQAGFGPDGR